MNETIRRRPRSVTTTEIERSAAATAQLLSAPTDWLRRLLAVQLDVRIDPSTRTKLPRDQRRLLEIEGFEHLCTAQIRHPGLAGSIEREVEVWVDETRTIRAETFVDRGASARMYFSTLFEDGTSLVSFPDATAAEWLRSPTCEVLCGTGAVRQDLAELRERLGVCRPNRLLCTDGATYRLHLRLVALRCSKEPRGSFRLWQERPVYPMTLMLAAEMIALRDAHADAVGLPSPSAHSRS